MAYTKQSFTDHVKDANGNVVQRGTTLKKAHLDHMEDGIFQAHEQLTRKLSAPASPQVGHYLRIKSIATDGTMVVEGVPAPEAALPERPTFRDVSLVPQSDQNAGATLVPEGTAERPKVGLYGCHGNEPVELCNVAEATEDESVPNLAQVREMISAATDGTIVPAGTVTLTENGDYDVTQYANAEVAIPEVTQALPEITVNQDTGKIGYTITQEEGYVAGGTQFGTIQQPAQAAKTVTPGVEDKVAVAKGRYVTGDVIVAGDPNLASKNIRKNATIFGIPGDAPEVVEAESLNVVHQWEKYSVGEEVVETEKANEWLTTKSTGGIGSTTIEFRYADEFKVENGSIVLVGATITSITDANKSVIVGKYIYVANKGYYRVPADATVTYSAGTYGESIIVSKIYQLSVGEVRTLIGVVLSEDSEAYPADGEQDGYWYAYIGTLENTGSSGGGAGYVVSDTPPEDTTALWVDTSEPEEAVALGVTATETAEGVDLYCTDELGTVKVSLRHGKDGAQANEFRLVNTIDISTSEEPFHITLTESDDGVPYFEEEFVVEIESYTLSWDYYTISVKSGDVGVTVSDCRGANHRVLHIHKLGARYVGVIYQDTAVNPGYPFDYQKTPVDIPVITELTIGPLKQFTGRVYARRKVGGSNA